MFDAECKRCGKSFKYELDDECYRKTTKIGNGFVCGLAWVLPIGKRQFDLCPRLLGRI